METFLVCLEPSFYRTLRVTAVSLSLSALPRGAPRSFADVALGCGPTYFVSPGRGCSVEWGVVRREHRESEGGSSGDS